MKDLIVKEHTFNHPMKDVWKAISDQDEISAWFIKADFQPQVGYNYTFLHEEGENCTTIVGKVIEARPIDRLVYTWLVKGTDVETTVSWNLSEVAGKTQLRLEHSGISAYGGDSAVKMFESFSKGWSQCINELESFLQSLVNA